MKVYITGVRGFLGTSLANALVQQGHEVFGCDLMEPETQAWEALGGIPGIIDTGWIEYPGFVHAALETYRPNMVVHLAARSTVENAFENPEAAYETNLLGTVRVLEACRRLKIPLVVASSDKAYGGRKPPFFEGDCLEPYFPYDVSKANADMAALSYARSYKMPVVVTRACNFYGPGDLHWNRLVPRSFRELAEGRRPVMYLSMERVRREWMHVDDCVAAYRMLIQKLLDDPERVSGLAVNVGTGDVRTLRDMMRLILNAAESTVEPIVSHTVFPELGDEWLNHRRLEDLGWQAETSLEDGLRSTWAWYKAFCGGEG